jgi:uncharacterized surface protein with fasciclin (FAS1) repeats
LPEGTVATLLKPENKKMLQTILTYHVVAGKMNASDIAAAIKKGKGKATMKTVSGGTLTAACNERKNYITDEKVVCQWLRLQMLINQMVLSSC